MKTKIIIALTAFFVLGLTIDSYSAVSNRHFKGKKKKDQKEIRSEAGLKIPEWGISVDATFNPELTDIIPGYHIVNLVLSNHRGTPIKLDASKDKWTIVDNMNKRHRLYNHVKQFDKDMWSKVPKNLKQLLEYPRILHPGKSTTIDVFIKKDTDLFNFKEISWKSSHFNKEFNVMTSYEEQLNIAENPKEFKTPVNSVNADQLTKENILQKDAQSDFIRSKYRNDPNIKSVSESHKNPQPLFDPSLDDMIIIK